MFKNKLFICLIGFYIFWLFVLPTALSKVINLTWGCFKVGSKYQIQVEAPHLQTSILPLCKVYADKISIISDDDSLKIVFSKPSVRFRLLPLLSGKFHINNLKFQKVDLETLLVNNLELDKDFFNKFNKKNVKLDEISIGEFEARFYQKDISKPILYNGKDFTYLRKNRYIKLKTNSALNIDGKISKVISDMYLPKNNDIKKTVFDITVENIDLYPLRTYFKHYLPNDLKQMQGFVNISANKDGLHTEFKNVAFLMKDSAKSIIFPSNINILSKFNITKNYIDFSNITLESSKIHISADGRLYDYFGKTMPTLDFKVRINKSRVEDLVNILPPLELVDIDFYKLKKYKLFGDILANFSIKGRLPEPDFGGNIYINNAFLSKLSSNLEKGAVVKLNLEGKRAYFDVSISTNMLQKINVKGSQELYNTKYADFIVKSSDYVNLKLVKELLLPLHEILKFAIGPLSIVESEGLGNVDLVVKGNRKNPHIWGGVNIKNATVFFKDVSNLKLTNADLVIKFEDQNTIISSKKAFLNGKQLVFNGMCDLFGKFEFNVISKNQSTSVLYNAIRDSKIFLGDIDFPKITLEQGLTDFDLKIYGFVKDYEILKYGKNLFAKGSLIFRDNELFINKIFLNKAEGIVKFDVLNADIDLKAHLSAQPIELKAKLKDSFADINFSVPKINPNLFVSYSELARKNYLPYIFAKGRYCGDIKNIDYSKLTVNSIILETLPHSIIKYNSGGVINVQNNKIILKNINGYIDNQQNTFDINLVIDKVFSSNQDINGLVKMNIPCLSFLNDILKSDILPANVKKYTRNYEFKTGKLNFDAKITNNKLTASTDLAGISFIYSPQDLPINIINGSLSIKNNLLKMNKINILADNMPVLIDGEIKDVFDKQNFSVYLNSKPKQEFIDKYINKNQIYPIKIKGDIVYWAKIKGVFDNYDLKAQIDMSKDSSIYHFGATVGDIENAIVVSIDSKVTEGNCHKIKEFSYDKMIDSQSGRQTKLNMLKAWGGVRILEDDLTFDNLRIKTSHPTDARIFNIIFRKPNIKQGQFTSDLKFNGKLSNAKVLGDFHIFETNIPFLDTTMKNIALVFKDKIVEFKSKGDVMGNDIIFEGVLKNNLTIPYQIQNATFYTKNLDLNQVVDKLKIAEVDNVSTFESFEGFDLNSFVANNFKIKADSVKLRNINANDFEAVTSLSPKGVLEVDDFSFNIAQGTLGGKYSYNLKTQDMGVDLRAEKISANDLSLALFDLNNQIYGDLTGDVNLTCNGSDFNHCMETLSGSTRFNVKDGRIPKLGSLEYLLKASNLVKGGLTGISINSIIDLLTPAKTGEFSDIYGSVRIKDGVARSIEITTKGEDLRLFISGTYNFATSIADMEVLGLLSRKISTMFGPIGNMSINTLFNVIPGVDLSKDSLIIERINKIPGIELSNKAFRRFIAEIKGNINGEDYVTSFKWIN